MPTFPFPQLCNPGLLNLSNRLLMAALQFALAARIARVDAEAIEIEAPDHEANGGMFGIWVEGNADRDLVGSGSSLNAALRDAIKTVRSWS